MSGPSIDPRLLDVLHQASSLELFQLSALIERLLADPRRIIAVRKDMHLGQTVRFLDWRDGSLREGKVVALRDTELLCLPSATFHALFASNIAFNQCLVRCMNLRLSQAMAMIEAGRTRTPEQRIALSLSRLFWSHTRQLDLTQDELASLAGMSRQTANRVLNVMQDQGLISLAMNRIKVLDDTGLTRLLV